MNRRHAIASMLAATAGFRPHRALAQSGAYPNRPIRMVVPVAAGGGVDAFGRLLAEKIKARHGAQFVVENRSGGNSTIGGSEVQRAGPDGYTILFHASTHIMARQVMRNVPYDPMTDFTPIALAGRAPLVLILANNRPQTSIAEVVAAAKQDQSKWSLATASLGAPSHLAAVAFNQYAGLDLPVIVYRGTGPALNDVAGGHVPLMCEAVLALLPMVRGGQVKALAMSSEDRSTLAPDIPTAAEEGMPGLNFGTWWGAWGPAGMPAEIVTTINGWINDAVGELAAEGRMATLGIEPAPKVRTPQDFAAFTAADLARSSDLLRAAKFVPE